MCIRHAADGEYKPGCLKERHAVLEWAGMAVRMPPAYDHAAWQYGADGREICIAARAG
jgi:hypothetical protein